MSPNGDLTAAFSAAKKSLQAAGHGTDNLGSVSVMITLKAVMGDHKDDTPGKQPKDLSQTSKSSKASKSTAPSFSGISPNGDLTEAFAAAQKSLQAAGHKTDKLGAVSVTITLEVIMEDHRDDSGGKPPK